MRLFITGATGFLGKETVAAALRRGHEVVAMVRPSSDGSVWANEPRVTPARLDLRSRAGLADALRGADAVLHLAAAKSGDLYAQMGGSIITTENLLASMREAGVRRLVLIGSFAVYDYRAIPSGATLTEDSPLEARPSDRDEYAQTKLLQERLARDAEKRGEVDLTVLRPGAIYGPGSMWTFRLGMQGARWWVRFGGRANLPLTHVRNCAEAIILAAERREAVGQTCNIVDDEAPTLRRYMKMLRAHARPRPRIIRVPWFALRGLAWSADRFNRVALGGGAKLPAILVPAKLAQRSKPLRYSNERAKRILGWSPSVSLEQGVREGAGR